MEPTTIILATLALAALVGLAWLGGYELGQANGITTERQSANRRINGAIDSMKELIAKENKRKPRKRRAAK